MKYNGEAVLQEGKFPHDCQATPEFLVGGDGVLTCPVCETVFNANGEEGEDIM